MSVLVRVTNFTPNTVIASQEVDDELNQLVNLLSGVSTNKNAVLKFSDGATPPLQVDQLGAGSIQQWLQNGTVRASLSGLGKLLLPAGIGATPSTDQISNFGTYFVDPTQRQTPASTAETDFSTKTISANVLAADGDFILAFSGITTAANANNKRYRFYWNATTLYDSGPVALNNRNGLFVGYFYRRSSTVLSAYMGMLTVEGIALLAVNGTDLAAQDFTVSNTVKSTGTNGTANAGDLTQRGLILLKGSV